MAGSQFETTARAVFAIKKRVEGSNTFTDAEAALAADGFPLPCLPAYGGQPPANADLHLHSNHSDGNLPPRKLVWAARFLGLKAIAIADHDCISGVAEAAGEGHSLGVTVVPACELSTGKPGCEIILYMPDTDAFLRFIRSDASAFLREEFACIQKATHERTLAIIDDVNRFLQQHGTPPERFITAEELSDWFSGQEPFYYGTLAVLGLKRLPPETRDTLSIHDPREFNTQVLQMALDKLPQTGRSRNVAEAIELAARIRAAGVAVVSILAHPRELETKGKMARPDVLSFVAELAAAGLDGLETACARDTDADIAHWNAIADEIDRRGATRSLIRCSFSSDFHVLNPGRAHGEITLGYGLLDEDHPNGNLRPQTTIEELLDKLNSRGRIDGNPKD